MIEIERGIEIEIEKNIDIEIAHVLEVIADDD